MVIFLWFSYGFPIKTSIFKIPEDDEEASSKQTGPPPPAQLPPPSGHAPKQQIGRKGKNQPGEPWWVYGELPSGKHTKSYWKWP